MSYIRLCPTSVYSKNLHIQHFPVFARSSANVANISTNMADISISSPCLRDQAETGQIPICRTKVWCFSDGNGLVSISAIIFSVGVYCTITFLAIIDSRTKW
ncbi:hypothetical protein LIPSTDRAFT_331897 [Lipomyces starkeyi NRRL Y-11557]|uniref:Uncharacterized protein n=1 Tax=Lipomyces starkeyi NRRL Y-11557 TaxID=675824 RepID=A0A1E3Q458_LIPST|nr:hypothetical protein LIPSTDRAFT_331897 [Lipomyces starkeyi NRRL Y-11557]